MPSLIPGARRRALFFSLLLVLTVPALAGAAPITVMWDANPEPDVAGYKVYVGTQPGTYAFTFDVGNTTTFVFPDATDGVAYYFAVSAYVSGPAGIVEGPLSAEVSGYSNAVPALANPGSRTGTVGQPVSLQLAGSDPGGEPVSYTASGLPPGLLLTQSTGLIAGTPTTAGTFTVRAGVTDGILSSFQTFTWTIAAAADKTVPSVTITSPTSAASYSASTGSVSLGGTASDNSGVEQVTWVSNRGGSGAASGTTNWSTGPIALQAGSNVITVTARDAAGNTSSDALTVTYAAPVITAASVSPNAGSGAAQTFTFTFADTAGATDLDTAWVWFAQTSSSSSAHSCLLRYDRSGNGVALLNDAGSAWTAAAIGSSTTLRNGACALAISGAAASMSGSTLTLVLPLSFDPSFSGARNIYLYAANASGINSGWQDRGDWTVPAAAVSVTTEPVTPANGSGSNQSFALPFSDSRGASALTASWVWFTEEFGDTSSDSCLAYYEPATGTLFLLNDRGDAWLPGKLGSSATLGNRQCAVALGSSSVSASGSRLTLNLDVTFAPGFSGTKNVYTYAAAAGGFNSGWHGQGTWTVPGAPAASGPALVSAGAATPGAGSGGSQTFSFKYTDSAGAADIATAWAWFNEAFEASSARSCLVYYEQATNRMFLLNDAGTMWLTGHVGSAGTLENAQCALALGGSSAIGTGNTLTLNLAMTFKPSYNGTKRIYSYAAGGGGAASGWQDRGSWSVPGVSRAVTADSATPSNGAGTSRLFELRYSDTAGAPDLAVAWVWFNHAVTASSANSCLLYYETASNTLFLLDDTGTTWMRGGIGTAGTLQNSQCGVALWGSTAAMSGDTLTLGLAVGFKPGYSGAKKILMYGAASDGTSSGWQDRGAWAAQ